MYLPPFSFLSLFLSVMKWAALPHLPAIMISDIMNQKQPFVDLFILSDILVMATEKNKELAHPQTMNEYKTYFPLNFS